MKQKYNIAIRSDYRSSFIVVQMISRVSSDISKSTTTQIHLEAIQHAHSTHMIDIIAVAFVFVCTKHIFTHSCITIVIYEVLTL